MKRLTLLLVLLTLPCLAESDSDKTGGVVNGRFWQHLEPMAKIAFIIGLQEGIGIGAATTADGDKSIKTYFEKAANYGEIIAGVDRLYQEPENAALPVFWVLEVFTMKVRGASQGEIDTKLATYRKRCIEIQERQKPER
jgi:hypothetical protein